MVYFLGFYFIILSLVSTLTSSIYSISNEYSLGKFINIWWQTHGYFELVDHLTDKPKLKVHFFLFLYGDTVLPFQVNTQYIFFSSVEVAVSFLSSLCIISFLIYSYNYYNTFITFDKYL